MVDGGCIEGKAWRVAAMGEIYRGRSGYPHMADVSQAFAAIAASAGGSFRFFLAALTFRDMAASPPSPFRFFHAALIRSDICLRWAGEY